MKFQTYAQLDSRDCGPTCLRMVAKHYGKNYSLQGLRERCFINRDGVSLLGISEAAEKIGFRSIGVRIGWEKLANDAPLPCIVHWKQNHFVVVYNISGKNNKEKIWVADPAHGLIKYTKEEFLRYWLSDKKEGEEKGIALLLEPGPDFYNIEDEKRDKTKFRFLLQYLRPHKSFMVQIMFAMLIGSLLQLIAPFLTQSVVDKGIGNQNIGFVRLVLIAQLVLMVSRTSVDFIRNWLLLHISTRINISLISDFLIKLMKLPIGFFDTKMIGDIMQRIGDHSRIQSFLTGSSLNILFSMINLIIFSIVLAIYSMQILAVFLIGSTIYFVWVWLFLKKRRELDFKRFAQMADNQSNLFQLITGMQEIKLNNCEHQKRWKWERIQARLFRVSIQGLALSQWQQAGALFFNETKNIFITFLSASAVIKGDITLGMMMSIQYIIGQLDAPVEQMISFMQAAQDAKISMERLGEIHNKEDEEPANAIKVNQLPYDQSIEINHLSFQYEGPHSEMVLKNINLIIPQGKTTAIVGTSGSGKTTLVKLMLGFYAPVKGEIKVGGTLLGNFNSSFWRSKCGAVMQDGFIFSDTIAENVAPGDENIDTGKLRNAARVANISNFIDGLPLGFNTKIGQEGSGISQGQRQRLLIARVVYKNPEYIFFDEATNSLDANNEKVIMQNLDEFFKHGKPKTVIVVAHRLSTVKNADQIIVLEKGEIIEQGTHNELTKLKGAYYELVKNQLELGN
ncbi:MAG: peptidase domain-containing ABC transporter [Lentimicrobiaceae bacterium]|nr:peptidase domain-containing ABC transporter [Lentimicrobiaceae bacterium]